MRLGAVVLMTMVAPGALAQGLQYRVANWPPKAVQGQCWELRLEGATHYENPFDPAQIALELEVRTPAGSLQRVPAFWYQGFSRTLGEAGERLAPEGLPGWRVRYTPRQPGRYVCRVSAYAGTERWAGPWRRLEVAKGTDGFVQVAPDRRYFVTGDGRAYFAIGENLCWPGVRGTYDYDDWFPALAANGANWARLWLNTFTRLAVERAPRRAGEPVGLGRYDLEHSWRVDYLIGLAEAHGLKVMLCLESFNALRTRPPFELWKQNPYNAALGGPLATPEEFFTSPEAKTLFKRRLRYCVARWSASPALMSWELWNEVDLVDGYDAAVVARWHVEMAAYLREIDPHRHLITTSYARAKGDPAVQALPEMDFIQKHHYGLGDQAQLVTQWQGDAEQYDRPAFFGEIGLDWQGKVELEDKQGLALHNALWAGLMSGAAGVPMTWWWDSYVHPLNLYPLFKPLSRFASLIAWERTPRPVEPVVEVAPGQPDDYGDALLATGRRSWQNPQYGPVTVVLTADRLPVRDTYDTILHGLRNHRQWHNPQTFRGTWPVAGKFAVIVDGVSHLGGGKLQVRLDGRVVREHAMPATQAEAQPVHDYDGIYEIEVPPGPHEIVVENVGLDWITVQYRLSRFLSGASRLRVLALAMPDRVWLWAQNRGHLFALLRDEHQLQPQPTPAVQVWVPGMRNGTYTCHSFDTRSGELGARRTVTVGEGVLEVVLPPVGTDVAYLLQHTQ